MSTTPQATFRPSICDDKSYKGSIVYRPMSYEERLLAFDSTGMAGEVEGESEADKRRRNLVAMLEMSKLAADYIITIAIERMSDGFTFSKWDELRYDTEMTTVISEFTAKLVGKFTVGDPS